MLGLSWISREFTQTFQENSLFIKESKQTFCLKKVKWGFLFVKESPSKLSVYQREFKQTFCLSKRVQANFLFVNKSPSKLSIYQRESKQTFYLSKRVQANFCSMPVVLQEILQSSVQLQLQPQQGVGLSSSFN